MFSWASGIQISPAMHDGEDLRGILEKELWWHVMELEVIVWFLGKLKQLCVGVR